MHSSIIRLQSQINDVKIYASKSDVEERYNFEQDNLVQSAISSRRMTYADTIAIPYPAYSMPLSMSYSMPLPNPYVLPIPYPYMIPNPYQSQQLKEKKNPIAIQIPPEKKKLHPIDGGKNHQHRKNFKRPSSIPSKSDLDKLKASDAIRTTCSSV